MSQAAEILSELQRRGVTLAVKGDALSLKPKRALDEALLARVREVKLEILAALRRRPATTQVAACGSPHCAGCYDVGDGRRIHPPQPSAEWLAWLERWQPKGKPQ